MTPYSRTFIYCSRMWALKLNRRNLTTLFWLCIGHESPEGYLFPMVWLRDKLPYELPENNGSPHRKRLLWAKFYVRDWYQVIWWARLSMICLSNKVNVPKRSFSLKYMGKEKQRWKTPLFLIKKIKTEHKRHRVRDYYCLDHSIQIWPLRLLEIPEKFQWNTHADICLNCRNSCLPFHILN